MNRIFVIAVGANLAFTIFEASWALIADSVSLLADAGHNLGDVLSLVLAWGASYLAAQKSSRMYSYGYRKTTILAALINALLMVSACAFIAFEAVGRILEPAPIAEIPVIVVALIGIVVNTGAALLFMRGGQHDLNLKAAFLHLSYDALTSLGVVITAVVILFTGILWLDPLVALAIGSVILWGTWGVLRDSVNLILDAVPAGIDPDKVSSYLAGLEGVVAVHDVHIWGLSTYENGLTAHLVMPDNPLWDLDTSYGEISRELERRFNIHHVTLQVERDQDCGNEDCD